MAYTFHKLYTSRVIESVIETSLQYSKMYSDHSRNFIRQKPSDSVSFLCGNAGIFAVSAVINQSLGNLQAVQEDLNQFNKGATVCLRTSYNRKGNDWNDFYAGRGKPSSLNEAQFHETISIINDFNHQPGT